MSEQNSSSSSTSESEISACSSSFDPLKVLYSKKVKVPVKSAPLYENITQFESAQKDDSTIIPVGHSEKVQKREEEKEKKRQEMQKELEEKNRQRFAQYKALMPTRKEKKSKNVLTRIENMDGPLAALKDCVDHRLRIKVTTRNEKGIRGALYGNLIAFDKQWNLVLSDVLEVWKRKAPRKRKIPPGLGTPVPKGTAANISPIATVMETPRGGGVWECTRHLPQIMMRGEHVVLINIVER